jgi:hypothetical protein
MMALAVAITPIPTPALTDHGVPTSGTATWYGSTSGYKSYCYDGYKNTCTPYARGEQVWYAAVGSWHYHDKPYQIQVCRRGTDRCVVVWVRDYCHGAWQSLKRPWTSKSRAVDLSPAAFMAIAGRLSRGIIFVEIRELPLGRNRSKNL